MELFKTRQLHLYRLAASSDWMALRNCYLIGSRVNYQTRCALRLKRIVRVTQNLPVKRDIFSRWGPKDLGGANLRCGGMAAAGRVEMMLVDLVMALCV